MGKSYFEEGYLKPLLDSMGISLVTLSNDKIRKSLIDRYLKENPRKSKSEAMDATKDTTAKFFSQKLSEILYQAIETNNKQKQVIFLDKNHIPNIISKTIDTINKYTNTKKARVLKLALVPEIANPHHDYPFSLSFLVQCYLRALERNVHETLTNEDPNLLARVQFFFFKQYFRQKFDSHFLRYHRFDDYLKVPFTYEHSDL